ncbi:hypothetical protein, partial [Caproicibacterium lactatifermentans]|uniref:hypothetical protein n=1 Tax=Caproicibacterium lactatifermentans TaxID=2666138 RepID=UPI003D93FDAE
WLSTRAVRSKTSGETAAFASTFMYSIPFRYLKTGLFAAEISADKQPCFNFQLCSLQAGEFFISPAE